jgi:hypothetical protein
LAQLQATIDENLGYDAAGDVKVAETEGYFNPKFDTEPKGHGQIIKALNKLGGAAKAQKDAKEDDAEALTTCMSCLPWLKESYPDGAIKCEDDKGTDVTKTGLANAGLSLLQEPLNDLLGGHLLGRMDTTQKSAISSFLSSTSNGFHLGTYSPVRGKVCGILKQMLTTSWEELKQAQTDRNENIKAFDALKKTLEDKIKDLKGRIKATQATLDGLSLEKDEKALAAALDTKKSTEDSFYQSTTHTLRDLIANYGNFSNAGRTMADGMKEILDMLNDPKFKDSMTNVAAPKKLVRGTFFMQLKQETDFAHNEVFQRVAGMVDKLIADKRNDINQLAADRDSCQSDQAANAADKKDAEKQKKVAEETKKSEEDDKKAAMAEVDKLDGLISAEQELLADYTDKYNKNRESNLDDLADRRHSRKVMNAVLAKFKETLNAGQARQGDAYNSKVSGGLSKVLDELAMKLQSSIDQIKDQMAENLDLFNSEKKRKEDKIAAFQKEKAIQTGEVTEATENIATAEAEHGIADDKSKSADGTKTSLTKDCKFMDTYDTILKGHETDIAELEKAKDFLLGGGQALVQTTADADADDSDSTDADADQDADDEDVSLLQRSRKLRTRADLSFADIYKQHCMCGAGVPLWEQGQLDALAKMFFSGEAVPEEDAKGVLLVVDKDPKAAKPTCSSGPRTDAKELTVGEPTEGKEMTAAGSR